MGYYTNVSLAGATNGFKNAKGGTTDSGVNSYVLLTTGSTESVKKMNLYDVAGNLWEVTNEAAYAKSDTFYNPVIARGGGFNNDGTTIKVYCRGSISAVEANTLVGFRIALFLQ